MGTFSQMLKEARAMRKRAQEELSGITGEDPNSMPGAENDKPVELPKEDPEVNDGSMGPKSTRTTEGKGDDRPITAGDLFEADESIVTPEEKPLETADANAKEAGAKNYANDILAMIHGAQAAEKKAEAPKEEKVVEKKPEAKKADEKSASAPTLNLELATDIMAKLACAMIAEKEGSDLAEKVMAKQAGAAQAEEIMNYIAGQEKAAEEYIAGQRAAVAYIAKKAQDLGAEDADAAIAAMGAPATEAAPEAATEAAPEAAIEGGEMLPEDAVAEVLLSQLQNGNLTEEDLGEIVMELAEENPEVAEELGLDLGVDSGDAGAAEEEPVDDGESAPVDEVEAEPSDEKAASAKKAVKKASSMVEKQAALMNKVAAASKLLVKHLRK